MITYKCFELHTHTQASDGSFTLASLCENAKRFMYDGIALTDHNTQAGIGDLTPELIAGTIPVISGIEWTTYFGHMVVIGADEYIDWRFAKPDDIDVYIGKIKKVNGAVGIAHPFNVGSPLCTGCFWDFKVHNWNNVDYIEVWSEPSPHSQFKNALAFDWWTKLLNEGHHLAASSGRDWHGIEKKDEPTTATYLGIRDGFISDAAVKDALRNGRTFVTLGPVLAVALSNGSGSFGLGDSVPSGSFRFDVAVDETKRRVIWERFGIKTKTVRIFHNGAVVAEFSGVGSFSKSVDLKLETGYIRVEAYGDYLGEAGKLLAFSSPIYIA